MKRKILLLVVVIGLMLCGCAVEEKNEKEKEKEESRITKVYEDGEQRIFIYVDNETGVQYLYKYFGYGAGLTVLLDADGKPLLYEGGGMND